MGLNGIDVSGWQEGIDLSAVAADFVIMKATQGTGFVSKDFIRQYQQAKENGKLVGCYHYAEGGDYVAEANHFLDVVGNRVGEAILCLDWEGQDNPTFGQNDFNWVKGFCDYVFSKTGVKPLVYIQKSAMERIDGIGDYGLWIAQYPDYTQTGYQETPWNEGAYACAIRQYSSVGRINGYNGDLDLDKFYGDADAWKAYAAVNGERISPEPTPLPAVNTPDGSTLELAERTKKGDLEMVITEETILEHDMMRYRVSLTIFMKLLLMIWQMRFVLESMAMVIQERLFWETVIQRYREL